MSEFSSYIEHEITEAYHSVAIAGIKAIRSLLMDEGFSEIKELRDFEIYVDVHDDGFDYRIVVDVDGVSTSSMGKLETANTDQVERKKVSSREDAKKFVTTYTMRPDGRLNRIHGMRDARKPARSKLKPRRPVMKTSRERTRGSSVKTSGERYVEHEFEARMPRGLSIVDKKIEIALQRTIRNTSKRVIYPQGDFQGIIKRIIEIITDLSAREIADLIPTILDR